MEITPYIIFLLIVLGLISGMLSSIAGIGGGVFFVSIIDLLFLMHFNLEAFGLAVDTSTFIILFSSLAGFITYLRQKRTNIKISLFFSLFSILGSLLSTLIFSVIRVDNSILRILFAVVLLIAGVNMVYRAIREKNGSEIQEVNHLEFSLNNSEHKMEKRCLQCGGDLDIPNFYSKTCPVCGAPVDLERLQDAEKQKSKNI